jgi:hypothetical protein
MVRKRDTVDWPFVKLPLPLLDVKPYHVSNLVLDPKINLKVYSRPS